MPALTRLLTNLCADDLVASRDFYTALFDFQVDYDSDWFVHLISADKQLELGIIKRTSDVVPPDFQQPTQGMYLTFVVDDVEAVFQQAQELGLNILQPPADTFYGQRRLLLTDPGGTLVDISSPMS